MKVRTLLVCLTLSPLLCAQQSPINLNDRIGADEPVRINGLRIVENKHLPAAELAAVTHEVMQAPYRGPKAADEVAERLRYALQERGYFKAICAVSVSSFRIAGDTAAIQLDANVEPGNQYRLGQITFQNAKAMRPEELRAMFPLQPGEIFNANAVRIGLEQMRRAYQDKGYVNFTPLPDTQVNDSTGKIALLIESDEGQQYHWGHAVVTDFPLVETKSLVRAFDAHQGQIFNASEFAAMLKKLNLPPNKVETHMDHQKLAVNFTVTR